MGPLMLHPRRCRAFRFAKCKRAGCGVWLLHAGARLYYLREVGLDRVAEVLERRAGSPVLVQPVCVIMYFELASSLQTTLCRADGS